MEGYVIIDSVLQAIHMGKYQQKPKHIKKNQIKTTRHYAPRCSYTVGDEDFKQQNNNKNVKQKLKGGMMLTKLFDNKKNKTKIILKDSEKLDLKNIKGDWNMKSFEEFFIKNQIKPKTSRDQRQHSARTVKLCRTPSSSQRIFYDVNIDLTKSKSRECIILPVGKSKAEKQQSSFNEINNSFVNIREIVDKQWEQKMRKRKIQCKSSSLLAREKTDLQKQAKKMQQQLKFKQNQEKFSFKMNSSNERTRLKRNFFGELLNSSIIPLSKQQINSRTSHLMNKYGIDTNKMSLQIKSN